MKHHLPSVYILSLLSLFILISSCKKKEDKEEENPVPTTSACFKVDTLVYSIGDTIKFKNCSENAVSYEWFIYDKDRNGLKDYLDTLTEDSIKYIFNTSGYKVVKLVAKNGQGQVQEKEIELLIMGEGKYVFDNSKTWSYTGRKIVKIPSGGYYLLAEANSTVARELLLIRYDDNFNEVWRKSFPSYYPYFGEVLALADNGACWINNYNHPDSYIYKISKDGDILKSIKFSKGQYILKNVLNNGGNFIFQGIHKTNFENLYLCEVTSDGAIVNEKTIEIDYKHDALNTDYFIQSKDGYFVFRTLDKSDTTAIDPVLIKVNNNFDLLWRNSFGHIDLPESAWGMLPAFNGGARLFMESKPNKIVVNVNSDGAVIDSININAKVSQYVGGEVNLDTGDGILSVSSFATITKLDYNYNRIWDSKEFNIPDSRYFDITASGTNEFILVGSAPVKVDDVKLNALFISKIDKDGKLIYFKQ